MKHEKTVNMADRAKAMELLKQLYGDATDGKTGYVPTGMAGAALPDPVAKADASNKPARGKDHK